MSDKTNTERIDALEKRVSELKDQVANASSPRLFMKAIVTLLLVGTFFFLWKARTIIKWLFLAFIAWMVFGGTVRNICSATGNFISTTWTEMRANGQAEDAHERELQRIQVETDAANSKVKAAADAQVSTTRAEADARTQVIQAEESAKQADWERGQAERRNDAVNDAIRSGHWNASTPMTNPAVSAPESPEIVKPSTAPMPIAEPVAEAGPKPNVTVNAPGRQPTVTRTQEGNTTRVVVRF
jgi:Sec-independent protein translocase protein TatA